MNDEWSAMAGKGDAVDGDQLATEGADADGQCDEEDRVRGEDL